MSKENIIAISDVGEGKVLEIHKIEGGWDYRKRIIGLGFVRGGKIKVIKNTFSGPVMVEVKGSKIALGRGEAKKILVSCSNN